MEYMFQMEFLSNVPERPLPRPGVDHILVIDNPKFSTLIF